MPLPKKLFDVRNLANAVDADTTDYPQCTGVVFRDNAARNKVLDAFADQYGYNSETDGTKQQFFNRVLTSQIKAIVRNNEGESAKILLQKSIESDLP